MKTIAVRVSDDFHYSVKNFAKKQGMTLQDYVVTTVKKDLELNDALIKAPKLADLIEGLTDDEVLEAIKEARLKKESNRNTSQETQENPRND